MQWNSLVVAALGLFAPASAGLIRFGCARLTVQRLDPLVNPGQIPSTHLHQIVGGNSFNVSMDIATHDIPALSTCTSCQFTEDFSNYWTAVLYFRGRNGSFKRVPQIAQSGIDSTNGGMMIYYMSDALFNQQQTTKVTAFKPGFRMLTGDSTFRTRDQAKKYRQLTYTCMENQGTRAPESYSFPKGPCRVGIMANHRFPTCWDGKNLDPPNHQDHVSYPVDSTFEAGGACPSTHPVRLPQLMLETVWDTRTFNNKADWPEDGSQPFVWSSGDRTGYSTHADYVFGWKADSLQKTMDSSCYVGCQTLKTQSIALQNKCTVQDMVKETIDGWMTQLPGENMVM